MIDDQLGGEFFASGYACKATRGRGDSLTLIVAVERDHPLWGAADLQALNVRLPFPVDVSVHAGRGRLWCFCKKGFAGFAEVHNAATLLCEWLKQAEQSSGFYSVRPPCFEEAPFELKRR